MNRAAIILVLLAGFLLWGGPRKGFAQEMPDRALVTAASTNAIASLRNDVLAAKITPAMSVSQFLEKTQSFGEMDQALQRCQQIGGPRLVDEQTVQVRMEISGTRVATTLVNIAAAFPHLSPINAGELDQRLAEMKQRTFSGTGTSVSTSRIEGFRPVGVSDAWASVRDDERVRTLAAARADAARMVIGSIRPIEISQGRTVGDLLNDPNADKEVSTWIASRPVTKLRYKDDLEVELTMAAPPGQVLDAVLKAAQVRPDELAMRRLQNEFATRAADATGRAKVGANPMPASSVSFVLPTRPPEWVSQSVDVEAVARKSDSPLRTKAAAERAAADSLRAKVGALKVDQVTTLDDLARQDAGTADAINRSLLRTRVYKVEYRADGSVMVRMTLDAGDLWNELQMAAR